MTNFEERRKELLQQMKQLEKEERRAKSKELKAEQRKKNDFCKKEFNLSYREVKERLSTENNKLSDDEIFAIKFWNDLIKKYEPADKNDLVNHILSDRQASYYFNNRY